MSAQIDTLSITVPGHVVRKTTQGSDSVLIFTGEQAASVLNSLNEVASLLPSPSRGLLPESTVQGIADQAALGKMATVKAPE